MKIKNQIGTSNANSIDLIAEYKYQKGSYNGASLTPSHYFLLISSVFLFLCRSLSAFLWSLSFLLHLYAYLSLCLSLGPTLSESICPSVCLCFFLISSKSLLPIIYILTSSVLLFSYFSFYLSLCPFLFLFTFVVLLNPSILHPVVHPSFCLLPISICLFPL